MAKLSIGEKAHRVLRFLMGLRSPGAVSALTRYGFTEADLRSGVERLNVVTSARLRPGAANEEPEMLRALDEFEGEWFPVARATLKHAYPAIAEWLFARLASATGADVAVSVRAFVQRIEELELDSNRFGEQGSAARAVLTARGLTPERVAAIKAIVLKLAEVVEIDGPTIAERELAEASMWSWYLEWSAIARVAIKERRVLRALGFRRNARPDEEELAETAADATAQAAQATLATPPLALTANAQAADAPTASDDTSAGHVTSPSA